MLLLLLSTINIVTSVTSVCTYCTVSLLCPPSSVLVPLVLNPNHWSFFYPVNKSDSVFKTVTDWKICIRTLTMHAHTCVFFMWFGEFPPRCCVFVISSTYGNFPLSRKPASPHMWRALRHTRTALQQTESMPAAAPSHDSHPCNSSR